MIAIAEKNWTIKETLSWAEEYLQSHGVPNCKTEAEYLLSHLLNCKRSGLYLKHDKSVAIDEFQRFMGWLNKRIAREPSQYIIGEQEFWGLAFKVTRDVLIPRPETEILVEEAVKTVRSQESEVRSQNTKIHYSELRTPDSKLILDLCTGSGCIAVSLAKEIPDSQIYVVDISESALDVARENAERHSVVDKITFIQGNLFAPLRGLSLKVDLIVSNPPYVSRDMMKDLQPEIRDYEPEIAVYAGDDGLDFYRRIISESPAYLTQGGHLILEIGYGQAEEIKKLIEQSNAFADISITKDFAGIDRVIKAQIAG